MIEKNQDEMIHLWDYVHLLWNKKLLIVVISALVISIGLFISLMTPATYTSECKLRLKEGSEAQEVRVYDAGPSAADKLGVTTELELLQSKVVIREMIENVKIDGVKFCTYYMNKQQPTLAGNICEAFGTTPEAVNAVLFGWLPGRSKKAPVVLSKKEARLLQEMKVISRIQSMIQLDVSKGSSVITINVTAVDNKHEAQVIANAIPLAYDTFKIREKLKSITKGLDGVREQVVVKSKIVDHLRIKLTEIRKKYNITTSQEETIDRIDPETVSRTKSALMDAKIEMLLEKETWAKVQSMPDSELSEAFGILMDDSTGYMDLKNDLNSAALQFKLLKIDFGESHPKVKRAKVELEELTNQMQVRIKGIKGAMKLRYEKSVTKYKGIKVEFDELRYELSGERSKHIQEFNIVVSELIFAKKQLDSVRTALAEQEVNQHLPRSIVEIISPALPSFQKSSPIHIKNLAISIFLGLALSVGLVFLLDYLNNTFKTIPQIEQVTGINVIATIPVLKESAIDDNRIFAEILNATSVAKKKGSKVMSVHSSMPGEGKSTICTRTAIESAWSGNKVLVIDMDVRRPTVHKQLKVKLAGGITDVIRAHSVENISTFVKETNVEGLSLLTAGVYKNDAAMTPFLMDEIIGVFREEYDLILIDCPPITVVNESLIIADSSDEVVIVLRPDFTKVKLVERTVSMLEGLDCDILGIVANQVSKKSAVYYGNKLYYKYYN